MELKQIKELMAVMGRTGMQRVSVKKEGFELELVRQENSKVIDPIIDPSDELVLRQETAFPKQPMPLPARKENVPTQPIHEDANSTYVTSPMVGTFYATPSPEDPVFVKVGDKIDKTTVVCIIEAMKVMNEVKSGVSGIIAEVLVENGHPVEFGTKLYRITPNGS